MDLKELRELIELVSEKAFAEFEIEHEGFRLRIQQAPSSRDFPTSGPDQDIAPTPRAAAVTFNAATEQQESEPVLQLIVSPIVGTFYRSPSPSAEAFVKVGDRVEPDTVVCIIEAMKLMNEVLAETSGIITEIYVENGQPVEFKQQLFGVKPS